MKLTSEMLFLCVFAALSAFSLAGPMHDERPIDEQIMTLIKELQEIQAQLMQKDKMTREFLVNRTASYDLKESFRSKRSASNDSDSIEDVAVCYWNQCTNQKDILIPGQAGMPGRNGSQGGSGETGPKGDNGFIGPRGIPGPQGYSGTLIGYKGTRGSPGSQGRNGRDGSQGMQGHNGAQGPIGERGDSSTLKTVYTRWGSNDCHRTAQLVYSGYAGGSHYNQQGGGVNYLCLPRNPEYRNPSPGSNTWRGKVYGSEYEIVNFPPFAGKDDGDVACAVCSVTGRSTVLMQPAREHCPNNWTREYHGYLMAEAHRYYRTEWVCVDHSATLTSSSSTANSDGALFYPVEGRSSSSITGLPPGTYINGRELTCAVCTQ